MFAQKRNKKSPTKVGIQKKAAENALSTLIEIIFFALLLLLVALPIIQKYMNLLGPKESEKKALETLALEINNWEEGKEGNVPLFLETYMIKGFKRNSEKPSICKERNKACLCLCKSRNCDEKTQEVKKCISLDFDLEKEYIIIPHKVEKEAKVRNCLIKRQSDKITISECVTT